MKTFLAYIVLIGLSAEVIIAQNLTLQCSEGWVKLYEKCYLIVPYKHSWTKARDFCSKYGAHLAAPGGYTLTDALSAEVKTKEIYRYWIGYNRIGKQLPPFEGYWSDGKTTGVEVGVWAPFEPNITSGECAIIVVDETANQNNRWYMTSCDHVLPFVCERNPCPDDTFTCSNGHCVSTAKTCDGVNDCGDESDEQECEYLCWLKQEGLSGSLEVTPDNFYGTLTYCVFTFETELGKRIRIKFNYIDIEDNLDMLEIWDGGPTLLTSRLVGQITGESAGIYESFISSTNHLLLVFMTDLTIAKDGFSLSWSTDFVCELLLKDGFSVIEGTVGYEKLLTDRQDVDVCITECERSANCWGFQFSAYQTVERNCFFIQEAPALLSNSLSRVYVNTCPHSSRSRVLDELPVMQYSLVADSTSHDLYTPFYPFFYIGNLELAHHITVVGNKLITLQIVAIDLCCTDSVSIHDGDGPQSSVLAMVDRHYTPGYIISSGTNMYIYMNLQQHWQCTGVLMRYYSGCDLTLNEESGVIKSPGYNVSSYPDIMTCSWTILPASGKSVRLSFVDFELEDNMDFLEIYKGMDSTGTVAHVGAGQTGTNIPNTVVSTDGIYLRLITSAVLGMRGFHAEYSAGCPVITSPSLVVDPLASSYHSPDKVTVTCAEGYLFAGSFEGSSEVILTCHRNGTWNLQNLPFCERQYCGIAPPLVNGYIMSASGVRGGDVIEYACYHGFSLSGNKNVLCYSNSTWGPLPECSAPQCPDLTSEVPLASMEIIRGNGIEQGSVVKVFCPMYYELHGPQTLVCEQGTWEEEVPSCRPRPCLVLPIWNSQIETYLTSTMNISVTVTCNDGYAINGTEAENPVMEDNYLCGVDLPLSCENINECLLGLDACENADCVDSDGSYRCVCQHGFVPRDDSDIICDDVDECSGRLNLCEHTCENTPGSYQCSCDEGYDLYTTPGLHGHDLLPFEDGTKPWHAFHLNHSCVLKSCDADNIQNIFNGEAFTSRSSFFFGDVVEFICDIGHYVSGTMVSIMNTTCQANGEWSLIPSCDVAYCDDGDNIESVTPQGPIIYEDRYTLSCTLINGQAVVQRQCGYDKEAQMYRTVGPPLICPETKCGEPPVYVGAKPYIILSYVFNSTIIFECEEQYIRRGESSRGNFVVPCGRQETWEFGTLHCEGGQCPDLGYPVNGRTTLSTWQHGTETMYSVAIGSVATFTCNIPGYVPEPSPNASCRKVGNEAAWDNPVPVCVDRQKPAFGNCPEDIYVERYTAVFYDMPYATDNTAVKSFMVYPENFQPGMVVDSTQSITYIATDYQGNQAWCQFRVIIRDQISPKLTCKLPEPLTASDVDIRLGTDVYLTIDDPSATVVVIPSHVTLNYDAIGTNPIISFSGTDPSGNLAVCKSQLRIDAPACKPETLHVYNADITCDPVVRGYNCEIKCKQGYFFYEDPSVSTILVSCSDGDAWSRDMPVCTAKDLAHYQVTIKYDYQLGPDVFSTCGPTYMDNINEHLLTLTNALTALCDNATNTIDVTPRSTNPVTVEIREIVRLLETKITLDLTPQGLSDATYRGCVNAMVGAFNSVTSTVSSVQYLDGGPDCPQVNMKLSSARSDSATFACTSNAEAVALGDSSHICLACPPGTFNSNFRCEDCPAGTYNEGFYKDSCDACPEGTSSLKVGARYKKDCYEDCGLNMYSDTGKAPCTDCPPDTYFVNRTYCEPCPSQTYTRGRGAISQAQCIGICEAGTVSRDGLQPCNLCPKHYYQASPGSDTCSECQSFMVTQADGSNTSIACVDGYTKLCGNNPCQNGGMCLVIRHDYYCNCSAGFTGRMCDISQSPCDLEPCHNGGRCEALSLTEFTCQCQDPFQGQFCEIDANDCLDVVCENNGTCIDQKQSHLCACASHSGFHGDRCQYPQEPCLRFPCYNSGVCVPQSSYNRVCDCKKGFSGVDCEINEDECASNPCINNAACQDGDNSFTCVCPYGYTGLYCHLRNTNIICNPQACNTATGCVDNYVENSKHCLCTEGWVYSDEYQSCILNNQYCYNVDCGPTGSCMTYDDGFHVKCHCEAGYGGDKCQIDIDECAYLPCKNDGICVDQVNNFSCTCPVLGTGGPLCEDIVNGCLSCVPENTIECTDWVQSYKCYCMPGYYGENCELVVPSCEYHPCENGGTCSNIDSDLIHLCMCRNSWIGNSCAEEIDVCSIQEPCKNGGECIGTSKGFKCNCPHNFIGESCEEEYDLCDRARPCVGDNSTCLVSQSGIQCGCQPGYAGDSCETLLWYCADDTCKNGGTCSIDDSIGVVCTCLAGYTGMDCSIDVDECETTDCPENSECIDGINEATCVCNEGKVGEQCEKDADTSFDYLILPPGNCIEAVEHPKYTTDESAFTLVFWGRATVINDANSFVSLYGVSTSDTPSSDWQYRVQVGSLGVRFDLRKGLDSQRVPFENVNIGDGFWHRVAVTWSSLDGYLSLYVDGSYNNEAVFGARKRLSSFGYIVLGEINRDTTNPFIGRISGVGLHNDRLTEEEIINYDTATVAPNIISTNALQTVYRYTFNSQLSEMYCLPGNYPCKDVSFNESMLPVIEECPNDSLYVGERVSTPVWGRVSFQYTLPSTRKLTAVSGETKMSWGCHGVAVAEYSQDGAAKVCLFRLYNKRTTCTDPIVPSGLSVDCQSLDDGQRCEISCKSNSEQPTEEGPSYLTCSKYGMWGQADRHVDYLLPSCSESVSPKNNLTVHMDYNLTQPCDQINADIHVKIKDQIKQMNQDWSNGFCKTTNGEVDADCDLVEINVECIDAFEATVDIVFSFISDTVGSMSDPVPVADAFKISYHDRKMFVFQNEAVPVQSAFAVDITKTCSVGYQLINNTCVLCGNGFYYDTVTAKCNRCAKGSYRTVYPTTSPTSRCTSCKGSDTTSNLGSPLEGYCHESCYLGSYYNEESRACEMCPVGFYNDKIGESVCSSCGINDTTRGQGSTNIQLCIPFASLTTTTERPNAPAIGASTEEEMSAGSVAAIVIGVMIVVVIVLLVMFLGVTNRLPCTKGEKKVSPADTSMKFVNRYGETNVRYVNFRLSDIKDHKMKTIDSFTKINLPEPVISETRHPLDSIAVKVPVFMEKLDGNVQKKHTFVSTQQTPDLDDSEFERTSVSAMTGSMRSGTERLTGTQMENNQRTFEPRGGQIIQSTCSPQQHHRQHHGRPPADLSFRPMEASRRLSPIRKPAQAPKLGQTSEYVRPPSPFSRERMEITPAHYKDFLNLPEHQDADGVNNHGSQHGSDKILLESDDEDLR